LLYVGTNPHVQEDKGDDSDDEDEVDVHLHDVAVDHEHEADVHYNEDNDRWTWMLTEIQRISTEQQKQGVEISGLLNDVQRGNRMTEENNQMLRMMMQHFHLQGPPYGPQ